MNVALVSIPSDLGIDVCLSCFQSGCTVEGRNHAQGHYHIFPNHIIYLNIRRTQKPPRENTDSEQAMNSRLAIAAETDSDRYDYHTVVNCYKCQSAIDPSHSNVAMVVDSVMKSLSSSQQTEIKAWEQEITACEHTLTVQQQPAAVLDDQNLATCSKCELNQNLWLCLHCGTLSCGRAQFGGGGGNGHGLQHVESTGHPIAVKLGSITPEGTADIYCYECDEERLDPMLQDHLAHWGIRLADRTKTEKSLQELQVEQNMKWEFSMTSEDGKEMVPLFGPGFTGMKNIGNSCYLASVIQCLFSLPQFQERFLTPFQADKQNVVTMPGDDVEIQLRKIADGLLSGEFSQPHRSQGDGKEYQLGIAPIMFKRLIGKDHAEFSTMRQQDAFEFFLHLIEKLNKIATPDKLQNPTRTFSFETEQRTQCLGCKKVAYRTTEQDNISVRVPARKIMNSSADDAVTYDPISITELLNLFTAEEEVGYTCSACSSKVGALKSTSFKTFPEVLVFNPGRFALENWVPVKLEIPVLIPADGFHLDSYLSKGQQPGEELLPDEVSGKETTAQADAADMEQLMAMGFPHVRAEKALLTTRAGAEAAMEWLFAHMDDPDIDVPYNVPEAAAGNGKNNADSTIVDALKDMGFPAPRCHKAAIKTGNNGVESAMDWLMQHMDDPDIDEPLPIESTDSAVSKSESPANAILPAKYMTKAMACHKGSSIHAGHYVAFIKKKVDGVDDWVLYNDEKVVRGVDWEEASKTAYVYFFERV